MSLPLKRHVFMACLALAVLSALSPVQAKALTFGPMPNLTLSQAFVPSRQFACCLNVRVTVTNSGNQPCLASAVSFTYLAGRDGSISVVKTAYLPPLGPGQSCSLDFGRCPDLYQVGCYDIVYSSWQIKADCLHQINESNELDNTQSGGSLRWGEKPYCDG